MDKVINRELLGIWLGIDQGLVRGTLSGDVGQGLCRHSVRELKGVLVNNFTSSKEKIIRGVVERWCG